MLSRVHTGQGGLAGRAGGLNGLLESWAVEKQTRIDEPRVVLASQGLDWMAWLWMRRGSVTVRYEYDPAGV